MHADEMVEDMKKHVGELFPVKDIVVRETVPIMLPTLAWAHFVLLYYSED